MSILNDNKLIDRDLEYICSNLQSEFDQLSGNNMLITGGAGFLGYYLVLSVEYWNRTRTDLKPINLTIFDNYIRGVPEWISNLQDDPNIQLLNHDMTQPLPADIGAFHYIIHAAGIASPIYYRRYPIKTMDANVSGLRSLLDYCVKRNAGEEKVEGFMFYSTSEIYGDPPPDKIPTSEDYRGNVSCTGPRACYDESKRYGETLCVNFAQQFDLPITISRPFNNYGPGLKITDRRVIPDFARDILDNKDIEMFSDGSPTRTFCYSADAVVGYYKVLINGQPGEPYNIGTDGPEISMKQLAEKIIEHGKDLFGYTGKLVHRISEDPAFLIDNPNRRCPDISKARAHIGYKPSIDINVGLERSLAWYSHNREAPEA